jgi:hypothetical protein
MVADYGGPAPPRMMAVLFPLTTSAFLWYRLRVGLVSTTSPYMLNTRIVWEKGNRGLDGYHLLFMKSTASEMS